MNFDAHTLLFMLGISALLQAIILVILRLVSSPYKGVSSYTVGTVLTSLGIISIFPFSPSNQYFSILSSNILILLGAIFGARGIGDFLNQKHSKLTWLSLLVTGILSQMYFTLYINSYVWRNSILSLLYGSSYSIIIVPIIFGQNTKKKLATEGYLAIVLSLGVMTVFTRIILLIDNQTQAASDKTLANLAIFIATFIFDLLRNNIFLIMVNQRMYFDLKNRASRDFLTQAFNRKTVIEKIEKHLQELPQNNFGFALILLDIDYFKKINDCYGHHIGDLVLQETSTILKSQLNQNELIGRWGGEEFLIFLPNCSTSEARDRAELLRQKVAEQSIDYPKTPKAISCTISLGVVTTTSAHMNLDELIKQADIALYHAKNQGRNQVKYCPLP